MHVDASGFGLGAVLAQKDDQSKEYVQIRPFIVISDHASLKQLQTSTLTGHQALQVLQMQPYNFQIIYRYEKKHSNTDALSQCLKYLKTNISFLFIDPSHYEYLQCYLKTNYLPHGLDEEQKKKITRRVNFMK